MCWFPLFLHIGTFATQFTKYSVCEQKWNANLHTKSVHNDRVSVSGWLAGCAIWMAREYSIEKCRCDVQNIRTVGLHTKLFALYSMSVAGTKESMNWQKHFHYKFLKRPNWCKLFCSCFAMQRNVRHTIKVSLCTECDCCISVFDFDTEPLSVFSELKVRM